jgi:hypothetical protein
VSNEIVERRWTPVVHTSRFWLAHRNGRVAAESGCERQRANPYRKDSPSYHAFFASFDEATA